MVAGLRNQSLISFNHFRKTCNHPNLYRSGYSRTSRLKTLAEISRWDWHVDCFGVSTNSSRVDAKCGITSYKPTTRCRSPTARLDYFGIADDTGVITWRLEEAT